MGAEEEEIVETQAPPAISARASRTGEIESYNLPMRSETREV
jgi:hypothetical protein